MALLTLGAAQAPALKTKAVLIWATNEPTSPDPTHKPAEAKLAGYLGKNFNWKYYYVVRTLEATIPEGQTNKFIMSDKSTFVVKNLGKDRIFVESFGDGVQYLKSTHPFPPGDTFAVSGPVGDDKTSWFVVFQNMAAPPQEHPQAPSTNKPGANPSTNPPPK